MVQRHWKTKRFGHTIGSAWGDVDNDGDLDLVTDGRIFINNADETSNHWLKVRLEGKGSTVNRSAIGAQVRVSAGGQTMTRQVEDGTGEGNQNEPTLHFGLGSHSGSVDVEVFWPDGTAETFAGVATDQVMTIPEPSTIVLLAIGAISLLGYGWRRRHMG